MFKYAAPRSRKKCKSTAMHARTSRRDELLPYTDAESVPLERSQKTNV
jgi:hypothetical protein